MIFLLKKYQTNIIVIAAILALFFAIIGLNNQGDSLGIFDKILEIASIATMQGTEYSNSYLTISRLLFLAVAFFGVMLLFFSGVINKWLVSKIQKKPYLLVVGLDQYTKSLLTHEGNNSNTIVVDSNTQIDNDLEGLNFGMKVGHAETVFDELNLSELDKCIISIGSDRNNITTAIRLISKLDSQKHIQIFIRIENRDLAVLFKAQVINPSSNVDVIPYSVSEVMAKDLFSKHSLLGLQPEIINTSNDYAVIVVGSGGLATEIIHHIIGMAHLPEQNVLTIYCVGKQSQHFIHKLNKMFASISSIPHLHIQALELDPAGLEFYQHSVWDTDRLTNIFIATDNDDDNLDISVNLQDTTYVKTISQNKFKTKVLFAINDSIGLSKQINDDKDMFENFYIFANASEAINKDNLIDEQLDVMAKLVNFEYSKDADHLNWEVINKSWHALPLHKKESNKAQMQHIDIKLLALGLSKSSSNKTEAELLTFNKKILRSRVDNFDDITKSLKEYKPEYFPHSFDSLIHKLARAEHNRWNAFHYLRGWNYDNTRDDAAKLHDCLLPIEDFDTAPLKDTYQYDMLAILNVSEYLSRAGYELRVSDNSHT
jgi:hypothetical protein